MPRSAIPVYDICSIEQHSAQKDLLIERFAGYLTRHYQELHRPHRHSFYHFVMFTQGEGSHSIDFIKFPVKPFQIYFMIPGQVHSWHFDGDVDGYIVHFNASLFADFIQDKNYLEQFAFFTGIAAQGICQVPTLSQREVVSLFESMLTEIGVPKEHSLDIIRLRLLELFIIVNRSCPRNTGKAIAPQKLTLLRSFRQLVDQHFRDIRLPKEYAELLYITPNHLNALCQDLMGSTAGDLIRERVLLEAKRMLTNLNLSVAEIAYDLNFQDNSYFNRFFKKSVGMTPDEFRKSFVKS